MMHNHPHPGELLSAGMQGPYIARDGAAIVAARFGEVMGMPPMQYLASWRIHAAAHELLANARSVAQVAEAVDRIERQFRVNALGPLLTVHAFAETLASGAKVALITSRMGSMADNTSGGSYGYRMSKAALNAAGRSLANDLASRGIAVGLLHPGYVRTDMTGGRGDVEPAEAAARLVERIDDLSTANSGTFRHANGEELPW